MSDFNPFTNECVKRKPNVLGSIFVCDHTRISFGNKFPRYLLVDFLGNDVHLFVGITMHHIRVCGPQLQTCDLSSIMKRNSRGYGINPCKRNHQTHAVIRSDRTSASLVTATYLNGNTSNGHHTRSGRRCHLINTPTCFRDVDLTQRGSKPNLLR